MELSRFKSERTAGAKLGQDTLQKLPVFAGKGRKQPVREGCLFSGQALPVWLKPAFQVDATAIFAPDGFDGIRTWEGLNISADRTP